jgi:glyoxylase-like metal-dependent hydrolase (beta-lactamase superfamily II)
MGDMYFQQFYLGCLSHASYVIGSEGIAAVVDPQRDVGIYIEDAVKHGLRIEYVIETHLHADFISGSRVSARPGPRRRRSTVREVRTWLPGNAGPHGGEHLDSGDGHREIA